jgi:hypothetical protein
MTVKEYGARSYNFFPQQTNTAFGWDYILISPLRTQRRCYQGRVDLDTHHVIHRNQHGFEISERLIIK